MPYPIAEINHKKGIVASDHALELCQLESIGGRARDVSVVNLQRKQLKFNPQLSTRLLMTEWTERSRPFLEMETIYAPLKDDDQKEGRKKQSR